MTSGLISPNALSDEQLRAMGLIAAEASYLEFSMHVFVWHLLGLRPTHGISITGELQASGVLKLAKQLLESIQMRPSTRTRAQWLMSKIDGYYTERNQVIHAVWFNRDATGKSEAQKFKRSGEVLKTYWTAERMKKLAEQIAEARRFIYGLKTPTCNSKRPSFPETRSARTYRKAQLSDPNSTVPSLLPQS